MAFIVTLQCQKIKQDEKIRVHILLYMTCLTGHPHNTRTLGVYVLSYLGVYKMQFPELFSGDGGGGRDVIPLIAEVDTVNAIMKWQQYPGQQEVYDSNAVQVFSVLNSMTKEAKAIEEANQKMRSHSKR